MQDVEDLDDAVVRVDEDGRERTEEWRPYATYTITDFFEDVIQKFEQLELVSTARMLNPRLLKRIGSVLQWRSSLG
jgi:hypothetical protein